MQRVYYTVCRRGISTRVNPLTAPHAWRPLRPLRIEPVAWTTTAEPEPNDLGAVLDAFEQRLLTALRVDHALVHSELAMMRVRAYPLETRPGPGDYPPEQITRFKPTRAELDDYLVVMAWFARLAGRDRELLWLRSLGFTLRSIAERKHRNVPTIRRQYKAAIIACWRHQRAAGEPARGIGA
jgi:hypothetical protein